MSFAEQRSKFGVWFENQKDITKSELEKASNLSNGTIMKLFRDPQYRPRFSTIYKINQGLKKLGKDLNLNDYLY